MKTRILWNIKQTLEENGIEIPFPQRVVHLHTVPEIKQISEGQLPEKEIESVLNYEERVLA